MAKVERYAAGAEATDYEPGDFILTHRHHAMAALISFAQRRRFHGRDAVYAHWSHAAVVAADDGAVVEAESRGVIRSPISKYRDDEYHLVRLGRAFPAESRSRTVGYAIGQLGRAFGYLDLLGAALYLVFGWPLRLVRRNHQTCSGLVTRALQAGGEAMDLDPLLTLPADLAKHFGVEP